MSSDVLLGPVRLPEGVLTMHTPRPEDARAWSEARLANRQWLERAFPAWGDDWAAEQSPMAWADRCRSLRAARRDNVRPFVLRLNGHLIGEMGIDAVTDGGTVGEGAVWMVQEHGSGNVFNVGCLLMIEHVFSGDRAFRRILSPVDVRAREGRRPGLEAVGFTLGETETRRMGRTTLDFDLWVLENTAENRERATAFLSQFDRTGSTEVLDRSSAGVWQRSLHAAARAARRSWSKDTASS